jgi:hypothetical protein
LLYASEEIIGILRTGIMGLSPSWCQATAFFEPPEPRFFAKNTEGFSFGRVRKMFSGRSSATYKRKIQRQQTIFYNTQVTSWSNPRSSAFPENVVTFEDRKRFEWSKAFAFLCGTAALGCLLLDLFRAQRGIPFDYCAVRECRRPVFDSARP